MALRKERTFALITGASRGFGRAVSLELAKSAGDKSVFLLLARDGKALESTAAAVKGVNGEIICVLSLLDNAKASSDDFKAAISSAVPSQAHFHRAIVIHNAGSIGKQVRKDKSALG